MAQPTIAWGATRNSVRIEFPANDHDGSDFIVSYGVQTRRLQANGQWTDWGTVAGANHGEGTRSVLISGLQPSTDYQVRVFARAKMWSGGRTYWGPSGQAQGFRTHTELAPDPPWNTRAHKVYYNRAEVRWNAPSHHGRGPIQRYTIHARQQVGNAWTDWGWSANTNANARSHTVTGYCNGGSHSGCPAEDFVPFDPQRVYQIRISARNQVGSPLDSVWSEVVEIQTLHPVPVAPGGPRVSERTHNSVRVSWDGLTNDGAERIINWGIDRREEDDSADGFTDWIRVDRGAGARSVVLTGLTQDKAHQVRVFARARMRPGGQGPTGARHGLAGLPHAHGGPRCAGRAGPLQPADAAPAHRRVLVPAGLGGRVGGQRLLAARAGERRLARVGAGGHGDGHQPDAERLPRVRGPDRACPGAGHPVRGAGGGRERAGRGTLLGDLLVPGDAARRAQRPGRAHGVGDRLGQREGDLERAGPLHGRDADRSQYDVEIFDGSAWRDGPGRTSDREHQRGHSPATGSAAASAPRRWRPARDYQVRVRASNRIFDSTASGNVVATRLGIVVPGDVLPHRSGHAHGSDRHPAGRRRRVCCGPRPRRRAPATSRTTPSSSAGNSNFSGSTANRRVTVAHGVQVPGDWALNPYRDEPFQGAGQDLPAAVGSSHRGPATPSLRTSPTTTASSRPRPADGSNGHPDIAVLRGPVHRAGLYGGGGRPRQHGDHAELLLLGRARLLAERREGWPTTTPTSTTAAGTPTSGAIS